MRSPELFRLGKRIFIVGCFTHVEILVGVRRFELCPEDPCRDRLLISIYGEGPCLPKTIRHSLVIKNLQNNSK